MTCTRPLVRYHGGKWKLAPWIISHFPKHRIYTESFGGGGSVLLRKPRSYAEIYNDLDGEIVNLFRVSRDHGEELARLCELTPFARDEYSQSATACDDHIEQARLTLIRSCMGFGTRGASGKLSGFRAHADLSGTSPAQDWMNYPDCLRLIIKRLRGVVIENRDAIEVMQSQDGSGTLHYVDPPYVHITRHKGSKSDIYRHEMSDQDHINLASALRGLVGFVVVSGYRCDLYNDLFSGWQRIDKQALADGGARERVESIWLSPNIPSIGLFAEAA